MKKTNLIILLLITSVLFVILFYQKSIGINLFLFEAVLIPVMIFVNRPIKFNLLTSSILLATGLTAVFAVIANTAWGIFINFVLLFCLGSKTYLWSYEEYYERMNEKKSRFLNTYKTRNILEWNLPDYLAYKKLVDEK
jgi:hypothetical protein